MRLVFKFLLILLSQNSEQNLKICYQTVFHGSVHPTTNVLFRKFPRQINDLAPGFFFFERDGPDHSLPHFAHHFGRKENIRP